MTEMACIAVTGANGFVGRAVCKSLLGKGYKVRALLRRADVAPEFNDVVGLDVRVVGEINGTTDWAGHLTDVQGVIHLAARVHVMNDQSDDPLSAFRAVNVDGTARLARAARAAGVDRFVFMSSIKVNGEATIDSAFDESSPAAPEDPYGKSKAEAEGILWEIAGETGLEVVILRPPLVYGPNVGANFAALIKLVGRGIPLPFGAIGNHRSLVHVDNLADACVTAVGHGAAANKTFLVSDGVDHSIGQMVRLLGEGMGKKPILVPVPEGVLTLLGRLTGKTAQISRLTGSLQIDSRAIRRTLNWQPPVDAFDGLRRTGAWFAAKNS
ncbi:UDP-glucose 4-epimerase family protein [Thalassospira alkalitolerans]|nr:SDR family oxidoreductase [Thalassospira alkalitolerans]